MNTPAIHTMSAADQDRAIATLTAAFSKDPIVRWTTPDDALYDFLFPDIAQAFGGRAFNHSTAYGTEDLEAVALWLPPGVEPDSETMGALISSHLPQENQDRVFELFSQMDEYHPHEPRRYLPLTGVHPERQGMGYGSALMTHALEQCDSQHMPAYLEATSEDSRSLYQRFGFETTGEISIPGSPKLWPMLRPAR